MKKLILLLLPIGLLYACSDQKHKTELINDQGSDSLKITSIRDTFNKFKGSYYVTAMVKNNKKDIARNFLVQVKYIDKAGDIVVESSNGAGKTIGPGDSLMIENSSSEFTSNKDLPYKVKVSVKEMF